MDEEKKRVQYTDPDGHVQDGWAIGGHVYQDEAGTIPMPVGSTYTTPDGKTYTKTASQASGWSPEADPYYKQMQQVMAKIEGNEPFTFDLDTNALYQQYKNQYEREGRLAMKDTIGQAAALTGGYGSTYAEMAGQKAYDAYLDRLNDKVPELYRSARDAYDAGRDALYEKWKMLSGLYEQDKDSYDAQAKSAYDLALLTLRTGTMPSEELLSRAGINRETAAALQKYYASLLAQSAAAGSSGGGGRSGGGGGSGSGSGSGSGDGSGAKQTGFSSAELEAVILDLRRAAEAGDLELMRQIFTEAMQTASKSQKEILQQIINDYAMRD